MYGKLFSPMWNPDSLWRRPACHLVDWQVNSRLENRHAYRDSANAWRPAWYISRCRRICLPRARRPPGPTLAEHFSSIPARPLDTRAGSESFPDNRRCNLPFPCLRSFQFSSILIISDHERVRRMRLDFYFRGDDAFRFSPFLTYELMSYEPFFWTGAYECPENRK